MSKIAAPDYPLGPELDFLRRIWQLNHALERLSSRMDQRLGVTAQQRLLIRCVGKYPGVTAGHLAKLLHVDPGTTSAALHRLEEKGLLERQRDPRDKRRVVLLLTGKGCALDQPSEGTVEDAVEQLLGEVGEADARTTAQVLERLASLLEQRIPRERDHADAAPPPRPRRAKRS